MVGCWEVFASMCAGRDGVSGHAGINPEEGTRGRWVEERMDLSRYAGRQILVRFWVVSDPAYNIQGLLLDEFRIPEIGFYDGGESGGGGWQSGNTACWWSSAPRRLPMNRGATGWS